MNSPGISVLDIDSIEGNDALGWTSELLTMTDDDGDGIEGNVLGWTSELLTMNDQDGVQVLLVWIS